MTKLYFYTLGHVFLLGLSYSQSLNFEDPSAISVNTDGAGSSEGFDFDQDGRVEFVTIASSSSNPSHFRIHDYNPLSESFEIISVRPSSEVSNRLDRFGGDIAWGDINGDGWVDIVVPDSDNSGNGEGGAVSWFENPMSGPNNTLSDTWTEHIVYTWSGEGLEDIAHMSEIDVGDINGDGVLDIVTRDIRNGVYILLQEEDQSGWQRIFVETNPREGLDLFNPDNDNDLDIILNGVWLETPANPFSGTYQVHTYGADWYPTSNSSNNINDYACQIAVADFNNDGREDIAISNSEELVNAASTDSKPLGIRVYLAPEDPKSDGWEEVIAETEHFAWHSLEPIDINNDGAIDFISAITRVGADDAPPEINVYLNNGEGTEFSTLELNDANIFIYNGTVGDFDGDGDDDFFSPNNFNSGPHFYFENSIDILPKPPENLTLEEEPILTIHLSWTDVSSNEAATIVERQIGSSGFEELASLPKNITSYHDINIPLGEVLTYRVKTINGVGDSAFSEPASIELPTDNTPPSAPQSFTAKSVSNSSIELQWLASTDISSVIYNIFQDGVLIAQTDATSYLVEGLEEGITTIFTIEAVDFAGNISEQVNLSKSSMRVPEIETLLVTHWTLNEGSGDFAEDEINSRVAEFVGNPEWTTEGRSGGGIEIDENEEKLVAEHIEMEENALTLALWVYPVSFDGNASEARFISKASSIAASDHDWMLGNDGDGSALRFRIRNQANNNEVTTFSSEEGLLPLNEWSHVAATYDGITIRLYHNGVQIASTTSPGTFIQDPSINIGIGNQPLNAGNRALIGRIDEIFIYNRALESNEILDLYQVSDPDYASWAEDNFTTEELADESISGPLADGNNDGISNLIDFATLSAVTEVSNIPQINAKQFSYFRRSGGIDYTSSRYRVGNLLYEIETSETLEAEDWKSAILEFESAELIPNLGLEQVFYQPESSERLFFRLKIELEE